MRTPTVAMLAMFLLSPSLLLAHPTGAALVLCPVEPCRFLDTRTSLGALPGGGNTMDAYVRGSALDASDGAQRTNCDVPPWAEAVMVNVHTVDPTASGHLKINASGRVSGVMGEYARASYRAGENDANEILVSLCNKFIYPAGPAPCGDPGPKFLDFQIKNGGPSGSSVHIISEVVGYYQRLEQGPCTIN